MDNSLLAVRDINHKYIVVDESVELCISAHGNNIIIPLPFDINAVTGIQLVENMFGFYCMFPGVMLYYMYERKSNTL